MSGPEEFKRCRTRYGLKGQGVEPQWVRDFPHPSTPVLGSAQPLVQYERRPLVVKRTERDIDQPQPSIAEVKERVETYICSPAVPSWPVVGLHLPLSLK